MGVLATEALLYVREQQGEKLISKLFLLSLAMDSGVYGSFSKPDSLCTYQRIELFVQILWLEEAFRLFLQSNCFYPDVVCTLIPGPVVVRFLQQQLDKLLSPLYSCYDVSCRLEET